MNRSPGFTLIELLIVVAIIAILAAIAVPNLLEAQTRSKVSRTKADLKSVATAMEAYAVDHNSYPPDWDSGLYGLPGGIGEGRTYANLTTPIAYMTSTPPDPFNTKPEKPDGFFDYWGWDAVKGGGLAAVWERNNVRWMSYSFGPDRLPQNLPNDPVAGSGLGYDPTNGTISPGDIGRCNTGLVPAG